jgi:hypothetical protein
MSDHVAGHRGEEYRVNEKSAGSSQTAGDGGCDVDWSWLEGREIVAARSDLQSFVITLRGGQTLAIRAALYDGKPFLSFTPWRAP